MNHSEAVKSSAAEKYLLGELPPEERDRFEEHFFECSECANDIRAGAVMVDNARAVLAEEATAGLRQVSRRPGWFGWLQPAWGLAIVACLVAILSYQNFVTIPSLKRSTATPQMLASFSLVTSGSRGSAGTTVIHAPSGRPFGIYLDIPAGNSFQYYTIDLRSQTGETPLHVQVSAEQAKETVQILVPAGALDPGSAALVVEGHTNESGSAREVARYPLDIQFQ
jgi:hypothetical protein